MSTHPERPGPALDDVDPIPLLKDDGSRDGPGWLRGLLALAAVAGAGWAGWLLLGRPARAPRLPELVAAHLDRSGVSNPITAVLLNFRAYDTLLEVVVLVAAMTAVWSMDRGSRELAPDPEDRGDDPVLGALVRLVVPLVGVTAIYLTWAGSYTSGGAFQAGALLAGAGVLLAAAGVMRPPTAAARPVRAFAVVGLYAFIVVGVAVLPRGGAFLAYPEAWAYPLILTIEAVLTVSIAVVLIELFVDVPAVPDPDPSLEPVDPTGDPLGRVLRPSDGGGDGSGGERA